MTTRLASAPQPAPSNIHLALNPHHSVIVEACAGSGKTWLLVSRMVRLLLDGVPPGEILAITFTRKAGQEMQARLHDWLHLLATANEATVRDFLQQRGLNEVTEAQMAQARSLYRTFLLAQPKLTISTFHAWFMQIMQRAPLNAGVPVGMGLAERTSALRQVAWDDFADSLRAAPSGEAASAMQFLLGSIGLHNTRNLLDNFVAKRAEWWAYTEGQADAVGWASEQLRVELGVEWAVDPVAQGVSSEAMGQAVTALARALAAKGSEVQCRRVLRRCRSCCTRKITNRASLKPIPNKMRRALSGRGTNCSPACKRCAML
jgi:ATP-dependent helicase/nuclease subunit A